MKCPFLNKECIKEKCMMWVTGVVRNNVTKEMEPHATCGVALLPQLLNENIRKTDSVGAAIESYRNADVTRKDAMLGLLHHKLLANEG